jgi:hypothetical protein
MSKVQEKAQRKAGKRFHRKALPSIQIDGDVLVPKPVAAKELGIATRTLSRMRPQSVLIGGFSYVAINKLRAQITGKLSAPTKQRRPR